MDKISSPEKRSQTPTVVKLKESTKEALYRKAHDEDRSISYLVERAVRRYLEMDK